jgi:hypothetical protein
VSAQCNGTNQVHNSGYGLFLSSNPTKLSRLCKAALENNNCERRRDDKMRKSLMCAAKYLLESVWHGAVLEVGVSVYISVSAFSLE